MIIVIVFVAIVPMLLDFLRHRRKSDTLWEIGQGIDKASAFIFPVVEGAAITVLAFSILLEVLAWLSLVV